MDCEVAKSSLEREGYLKQKEEEGAWLRGFEWVGRLEEGDVRELESVERGGREKEEGKL